MEEYMIKTLTEYEQMYSKSKRAHRHSRKHKSPDEIVREYISDNTVMVFSKSYCPFCKRTKELLKSKGVKFEVVELDLIDNGADLHASLK